MPNSKFEIENNPFTISQWKFKIRCSIFAHCKVLRDWYFLARLWRPELPQIRLAAVFFAARESDHEQRGWNAVISYPKLFVVVLIVFLLPETFSDTYNSQYWLLFHSNWEAHVNHRFWNQLCSEIVLDHHNSISFRGITIISERPTIKF